MSKHCEGQLKLIGTKTVKALRFFLQINVVENGIEKPKDLPTYTEYDGKHRAQNIDKLSRKILPMVFVLFNMVYWITYTIPEGDPNMTT